LTALAKLGDHNAFKELYTQNKEKIFNLTYRYTANQQEAEAAAKTVKQRRFFPYTRTGKRKNVTCTVILSFNLKNRPKAEAAGSGHILYYILR